MGTVAVINHGKHYKAVCLNSSNSIPLYGTTSLYKWAGLFDISQRDQNQKCTLPGT